MSRKCICIIAFKHVRSTIHVLKQIHYLSPHYDLTVIGHGEPDPAWPSVTWQAVPVATRLAKAVRLLWYAAGKLAPRLYKAWYWHEARFRQAFRSAVESGADAFHANDWQSLPIAVEAARRTKARVVFHQHEYAELEREDNPLWRLLVSPALRYLLSEYTSDPEVRVDASITVCGPIAERYRRELGIDPIVVYNAPLPVHLPDRSTRTSPSKIRLIHHGYAQAGRGLHQFVQAIALSDSRYTLDFMLMNDNPQFVQRLKELAERVAPGRVFFRDPVEPMSIVETVAEYDIGLCVIQPVTYNTLMMLPNKFFEYIQAGLAVCIGPSPAMLEVAQPYGVGICAPSFRPQAVAETLNRLTVDEIGQRRMAARRAAGTLNADVEMGKVVALYQRLFDGSAPVEEAARGPAASAPSAAGVPAADRGAAGGRTPEGVKRDRR